MQVDGIRLYPKIDPQPSEANILKVYRNYNSLRANPSYRRKITWIESYSISCIEYKGIFPGAKPHGNSKQKTEPYIRTPGHVLEQVGKECKNSIPSKAYRKLVIKNEENHRPKDLGQVQQKKYKDRKKERETNGALSFGKDLASQVRHLENMNHTSNLIQEVRHSGGHIPTIIIVTA